MRKKQIILILVVFTLLNVVSFPFVFAEPQKISSDLEDELSRLDAGSIDAGSINVLIETYDYDYTSIVSYIEFFGGVVTNEFKYASGLAAEIPINAIENLKDLSNVKKISKDEIRQFSSSTPIFGNEELDDYIFSETELSMDGREVISLSTSEITKIFDSVPETYWNYLSMNAWSVWESGYMGQDSLAVIIDTGVYDQHIMIQHAVIGGIDLSPDSETPGNPDWNSPLNHWHGTHCAGILAGDVALIVPESDILYQSYELYTGISIPASVVDPGYSENYYVIPLLGMAPEAQIFGIKVFPSSGAGVPTSYIINAIEYAIGMHESGDYDVDVISMSLGGGTGYDGRDLEAQTVDYATSIGITVVTSAGNDGPASLTVGSPGCANTAIAVGAVADPVNTRIYWDVMYDWYGLGYYLFTSETPQVIYFSSRGTTSDGRLKPELCATGVYVLSSYIDPLDPSPYGFAWASGTSMACPAVAGAVALLNSWGEWEGASPYDYKQALMDGAIWMEGYDENDQGAGNLNAYQSWLSLINDDSLGDDHPGLRKCYRRSPVRPNGINTHISEKGRFTYYLKEMEPGHPLEFYLLVTEKTKSITIILSHIDLGDDPLLMNSFELSVQSAVRTGYDYHVESFNINGTTTVEIEDYSVTWTEDNIWGTDYYQETPLQPGYYKVCVENDWTSYDVLSGKLEIIVEKDMPCWDHHHCWGHHHCCCHCHWKYINFPDETYKGTITTDEAIGWIPIGAGDDGVIVELWWKNDWTRYPTSDLDMVVAWFDTDDNLHYEYAAGGSLRSPEGVYLPDAVAAYILIFGYETYGVKEHWKLYVWYQ